MVWSGPVGCQVPLRLLCGSGADSSGIRHSREVFAGGEFSQGADSALVLWALPQDMGLHAMNTGDLPVRAEEQKQKPNRGCPPPPPASSC